MRVKKITRETPRAFSITLQPPQRITYRPGQFLNFYLTINDTRQIRSYSLSSIPMIDSDLTVTVKEVPGGLVSNWLSSDLKIGDEICASEPMGEFGLELTARQSSFLIMFAGGCGITPLMSIIKSTLLQGERQVYLVYFNRSEADIIFYDELQNLEQAHKNRLKVIHVLSQPSMEWRGLTAPINAAFFYKLSALLPVSADDSHMYLMCGPSGLMDQLSEYLLSQGINETQILRENFNRAVSTKTDSEIKVLDLSVQNIQVITSNGIENVFVKAGQTILDAILEKGLRAEYGCKSGICGACYAVKVQGAIGSADSKDEVQQPGNKVILTCTSHPMTQDVIIDCSHWQV